MNLIRRLENALTGGLVPLALLATAVGVLAPARQVAVRSDVILAALVLLTALGIDSRELVALRPRWRVLLALSLGPFVVLGLAAWGLSRAFSGPVRDGVLALGFSSTEVAMVGLVALAGAEAAVALGALAGSLVVSALAGPIAASVLGGAAAPTGTLQLLGRFALIVLVPLAVGVAIRAAVPPSRRAKPELAAGSSVMVALLVYAALSGATGRLALTTAAAAAFLVTGLLVGVAWWLLAPRDVRPAGAFAVGGRDFAVAATLAAQAFGPAAGAVAGIYGVLVLIAGALSATALRRHSPSRR